MIYDPSMVFNPKKYKIVKTRNGMYRAYVRRFFFFWQSIKYRASYGGGRIPAAFNYISDAEMAIEAHRHLENDHKHEKQTKEETWYYE